MDKILTEEQEKMSKIVLKEFIRTWGIKVFDTEKCYTDWLCNPAKEFGGSRPYSLFDTIDRMHLLLLVLQQKYRSLKA